MERIILAGIELKNNSRSFRGMMAETRALCAACGMTVLGEIVQKSRSLDPSTAFRKGKLEELTRMREELDADGIVFHNSLSVDTANRIASVCGAEVIDRTAVILRIFSLRARSRQARLQTEMARLQYDLPGTAENRNTGGHERGGSAYNRGAGEMRSAAVARRYEARIAFLRKELKKIDQRTGQDERRRAKTLMRRAALVGYTNAGKSSVMNCLLKESAGGGAEVEEKDMLFATLDTSVRKITVKGRSFLLSDTVGFVSDLPHTLIDAFHATLRSAAEADLLIHVIDYSDPEWQEKEEITEKTLREIGASDIPVLRIFNKCDLKRGSRADGMMISCRTGEGIRSLSEEIFRRLYPDEDAVTCRVPYDRMNIAEKYFALLKGKVIGEDEEGTLIRFSGPADLISSVLNELGRKKTDEEFSMEKDFG